MSGCSDDTTLPRGASNAGQTGGAEGGNPARKETPDRTKMEVSLETGLTPEEYIIETIDTYGGRLPQQAIIEITGWGSDAISTLLVEMEDGGSIERIWMGREKMVYLPGAKSDLVAPPEPDEARSR